MAKRLRRPAKEAIRKALEKAGGNFTKAAQMFEREDGTAVPWSTFRDWVEHYQLDYVPKLVKKTCAKMVLDTAIRKALDGDNYCIGKVLDRWGALVGFEELAQKQEINHNISIVEEMIKNHDQKDLVIAVQKSKRKE